MIKSLDEFIRLRLSENPEEYNRTNNEEVTDEVWIALIKSHPDGKRWAFYNSTIPLNILYILANDEDANVRCGVADRDCLDDYLIVKLINDPDEDVRGKMAYNSLMTKEQLEILAQDSSVWVSSRAKDELADRAMGIESQKISIWNVSEIITAALTNAELEALAQDPSKWKSDRAREELAKRAKKH